MGEYNYMSNFPPMPGDDSDDWRVNPKFDLSWVNGLFKVGTKSMGRLYGSYAFKLDEDDFDLNDLRNFASNWTGVIVYSAIWAAAAIIFTLVGIVWCSCNKCKCCCGKSSFKDRGDDDDDELESADPDFRLPPLYPRRMWRTARRPSTKAIVAAVFLAFLLLSFMLMIIYTFGANEKVKEGIHRIDPDLDNALFNILCYLAVSIKQLTYTFIDTEVTFMQRVNRSLERCTGQNYCDGLKVAVNEVLGNTTLKEEFDALIEALQVVELEMKSTRSDVDNDFERMIEDVNDGLYWLFMLLNVLYLLVFCLLLNGTAFALFAKKWRHQRIGFVLLRVAIVIIFIIAILAVLQMLVFFLAGGILSEAICPAIREIEDKSPDASAAPGNGEQFQDGGNSDGVYRIPSLGKIIRDCKAEKNAYVTFDLQSAVRMDGIRAIGPKFREAVAPYQSPVADTIQREVDTYYGFVEHSITKEVGMCKAVYHAMDTTINLFCYKVAAPIVGFWWILQFLAVTFLLIVVTALVFERLM